MSLAIPLLRFPALHVSFAVTLSKQDPVAVCVGAETCHFGLRKTASQGRRGQRKTRRSPSLLSVDERKVICTVPETSGQGENATHSGLCWRSWDPWLPCLQPGVLFYGR